jgi:PAS domain S-box-containing protein
MNVPNSPAGVAAPPVVEPESVVRLDVLRESEARYHSLFEGSRDAIYVTAQDGRFLDVNSSFVRLFGYTRNELLRLNARVLYADPADRIRFQRAIESADAVRDYEVR